MLQTINNFFLPPFSWLEKPRNCMGKVWTVWWMFWWGSTDPLFPSRTQNSIQISPPCDFWAFPTMKRELWGNKFWSDRWSAACFREVGGVL
jgi:hypothetical protein